MKTVTAFFSHLGITVAQAFVAAPLLSGNSTKSALGNTAIQVGAQLGLSLLQAFVASKNSNSDPNGNTLVPGPTGFQTTPSNK